MLRVSAVGLALGVLLAVPLLGAAAGGLGAAGLARAAAAGAATAVGDVGLVLVPQLVLAVAVGGLALEQLGGRLAGLAARPTPAWLEPGVESALLLGMLGTISGMVTGFVGVSPDALEPGPLVHSLGRALRSSFVGFGIALVGVWIKARPGVGPREACA